MTESIYLWDFLGGEINAQGFKTTKNTVYSWISSNF